MSKAASLIVGCNRELAEGIVRLARQFTVSIQEVVATMHAYTRTHLHDVPDPSDPIDFDKARQMMAQDAANARWILEERFTRARELPNSFEAQYYRRVPTPIETLCDIVNNTQDWYRYWAANDPDLERRVWWKAEHDACEDRLVGMIERSQRPKKAQVRR
jgi:hypothetical protein